MKKIALAAGVLLATATTLASAQLYDGRNYNAYPERRASGDQECWNPRAGRSKACVPANTRTTSTPAAAGSRDMAMTVIGTTATGTTAIATIGPIAGTSGASAAAGAKNAGIRTRDTTRKHAMASTRATSTTAGAGR